MTPSEKKASGYLQSKASDICRFLWARCLDKDASAEEDFDFVLNILNRAERRGFERAKELAAKIGERYEIAFEVSSKIRSLTHDEA